MVSSVHLENHISSVGCNKGFVFEFVENLLIFFVLFASLSGAVTKQFREAPALTFFTFRRCKFIHGYGLFGDSVEGGGGGRRRGERSVPEGPPSNLLMGGKCDTRYEFD